MRLFRKFVSKREGPPTPPWMYWLVIAFVLYAFANGVHKGPNKIHEAAQNAIDNLSPQKLIPIEQYKNVLFPAYTASLNINDIEEGKGAPAVCGQEIHIAYSAQIIDGDTLTEKADKTSPLVFRIGDGSVIPALDQGVTGMRPGGKRSLIATLAMSYGIEKFKLKDANFKPDARIRFDVEMIGNATPALPDIEAGPYRIATIVENNAGAPVFCGEETRLNVTLWSGEGKKLFTTKDGEPIVFTPGKSQVFLGLEQGVIGMTRGGMRTLIVPPDFQKTMLGNEPAIHFPLPKTQTVLVDVEALP